MNPVHQDPGPCPCGDEVCTAWGTILLKKTGHLRGCGCSSCRNGGNYRAGHGIQQTTHERLGGTGRAPTNEDRALPYVVEAAIMPESKTGDQVPDSWQKFVASKWFVDALRQARRAAPIGANVFPAVAVDAEFVILDIRPQRQANDASR